MFSDLNKNILFGKNLFILYLVISSNFLGNLFGCQIQNSFTNNILIKHLLGFLTLFFFIGLAETSDILPSEPTQKMVFSFVIYILFLFSTRIKVSFWFPFIICLALVYIVQIYKEYENKQTKPDKSKVDNYLMYQKVFLGLAVFVSIIGFVVYFYDKKVQHGDSFSYFRFIFGNTVCDSLNTDSLPSSNIETGDVSNLPTTSDISTTQSGGAPLDVFNNNTNTNYNLDYEPADKISDYFD
jgi:hypothetical protein